MQGSGLGERGSFGGPGSASGTPGGTSSDSMGGSSSGGSR
jgi:hypothetical protein